MEQEKIFLVEYAKNLFVEDNNNKCVGFVRHFDDTVLSVTGGLFELLGYKNSFDIVGLNLDDLFAKNSNYSYFDIATDHEKLKQGAGIVDIIIKLKSMGSLVLFSLIPIQYNNKYIGYYAVGRNTRIPSYMELMLLHTKKPKFIKKKELANIILNEKEKVILFLLISGFTQNEIAEYLGCSRGFVGKMIAKRICPKFGLVGSSTKLLVQQAILHGVLDSIPEEITQGFKAIHCA